MDFAQHPESSSESVIARVRLMPIATDESDGLSRGELVQGIEELAELIPFGSELELPRRRVWARLSAELERSTRRNAVA